MAAKTAGAVRYWAGDFIGQVWGYDEIYREKDLEKMEKMHCLENSI
jgi:hypothetical protein